MEPSWLAAHSDLAISVINARRDFPLLRKSLSDLESNEPARRNSAYVALVDHFFLQAADEIRRQDLAEILSHCLAMDPIDASAGQLLNALLREVPEQSEKIALDAAAFPRMFWGVRTVVAALAQAKGQAQRIAQIVAAAPPCGRCHTRSIPAGRGVGATLLAKSGRTIVSIAHHRGRRIADECGTTARGPRHGGCQVP